MVALILTSLNINHRGKFNNMAKKAAKKPVATDPIYNYGWIDNEIIEMNQEGFTDANTQKNLLRHMLAEGGPKMRMKETYNGTPEEYFTKMYGAKTTAGKNLGNKTDADAVKYYGRGFIHLTGRYNYERLAKLTGIDIVNNPDLAAEPANARKIMYAYLKDRAKTHKLDLNNPEHLHKAIAPKENWQQRQARVLPISDMDYSVNVPVPPNPNPQPPADRTGKTPLGQRMTYAQFLKEQGGGITPDTTPPAR
jgi:hypothetical protein